MPKQQGQGQQQQHQQLAARRAPLRPLDANTAGAGKGAGGGSSSSSRGGSVLTLKPWDKPWGQPHRLASFSFDRVLRLSQEQQEEQRRGGAEGQAGGVGVGGRKRPSPAGAVRQEEGDERWVLLCVWGLVCVCTCKSSWLTNRHVCSSLQTAPASSS